jgi:hypothetical protein
MHTAVDTIKAWSLSNDLMENTNVQTRKRIFQLKRIYF